MALISLGMPVFSGTEEDDLELFISLYRGYLASVNVNPLDLVANPSGASRAMGILRSCMQGPASVWFDTYITGKNFKLANINKNTTQAGGNPTMAQLRALTVQQGVAGGMGAGTYRAGSEASAFSADGANGAVTVGNAFIPLDTLDATADIAWKRAGGEGTNDPPNRPRNNGNGNGTPIVLADIRPGQALYLLRTKFPTILEEKRRLRFGSLAQDDLPIRDYYNKVVRAGQLLGFSNEVVNDQFFRGLSPSNILELERIGIDRPVSELVDIAERVEKRKAEMHLGLTAKKAREDQYHKKIEPIQKPPISHQEPVEIKPVTSHAITQDMLNKLLQAHTENLTKNFQAQLQNLQEKVTQPMPQPAQPARPPIPSKITENMHRYYEDNAPNPFEDNRQWSMEEIMGSAYPKPVMKIAEKVARNMARAKERQEDRELARAMRDLHLEGREPEPMDIDAVRIGDVEVSKDDLNEYISNLLRSKKK